MYVYVYAYTAKRCNNICPFDWPATRHPRQVLNAKNSCVSRDQTLPLAKNTHPENIDFQAKRRGRHHRAYNILDDV